MEILFYCIISSWKQTNSRTRQKIQQSLLKCIKVQNRSGTKLIYWELQDQVNGSILFKWLVDNDLHKHLESIRRKIVIKVNVGSNKVCAVSFKKSYNFPKLC